MIESLQMVAQYIADDYSGLPEVQAVALAGSVMGMGADAGSDIDLYVYAEPALSVDARLSIATRRATRYAVDNQFWEAGDEWQETVSGVAVDVTFRSPAWIEDQLDRVLARYEASTGYSTCFWYNILNAQILFDRNRWLSQLQERAKQPYPDALRLAIIAKNHPLLRDLLFSAYSHQIEKAVKRNDLVSVNHRIAAFLASYFDILFAVNRQLHPGEKKLIAFAEQRCPNLPQGFRPQIEALLQAAAQPDERMGQIVNALVDDLDALLVLEGFQINEQFHKTS
ncbi:MAG: DUF4037 domain-containing protein [Anaerolineae bacterium]|nr:DUF4037 domain-containing protein [Anaerolineae bacterium]